MFDAHHFLLFSCRCAALQLLQDRIFYVFPNLAGGRREGILSSLVPLLADSSMSWPLRSVSPDSRRFRCRLHTVKYRGAACLLVWLGFG